MTQRPDNPYIRCADGNYRYFSVAVARHWRAWAQRIRDSRLRDAAVFAPGDMEFFFMVREETVTQDALNAWVGDNLRLVCLDLLGDANEELAEDEAKRAIGTDAKLIQKVLVATGVFCKKEAAPSDPPKATEAEDSSPGSPMTSSVSEAESDSSPEKTPT